jgi:hypothetical protein
VIERVALGQTRFATPGVAPDGRGVALGKLGLLLFPALDGVVRWLRLYADEDSLDDLLPGMKILRVMSPLRSRACLLVMPAASSYVLDRAARLARLAGGAAYTGTSRHFVAYRDERSPNGYDVVDLGSPPAGSEYVLHGAEATQAYAREGDVDVAQLIFRLSLRRVPGAEKLDAEARAQLYLTAASGLAPGLIRYLLRYRVRAEVTLLHFERRSAFAAPGEEQSVLLRVHELPERLLGSLAGVPGLCLLRPVGENIGVEIGYEHPIALTSASSLFPRERFHLFFGAADRLDVVKGPFSFAKIEHLGDLGLGAGGAAGASSRAGGTTRAGASPAHGALDLGLALRLVPTLSSPRRVVAALVGWDEAARLKKLVYALPPVLLSGHRLAVSERGLLLVAAEGVDVIPLGTLLAELAPGLLVPVGMDLTPRVPTEVLAAAIEQALGEKSAEPGRRLTVFPHEGGPFFVDGAQLLPLERQALAKLQLAEAPAASLAAPPVTAAPRLVNDRVGRFALWGFAPGTPPGSK